MKTLLSPSTRRVAGAAAALTLVAINAAACSTDPTEGMSPAPGITAQQPSDGTPITVELITPERCPASTTGSPWTELVADGSLPQLIIGCQDHDGRGVFRYTVRMHQTGTLVLSVGASSTTVDAPQAVHSGQVSLDYSKGNRDAAAVAYSLFTAG